MRSLSNHRNLFPLRATLAFLAAVGALLLTQPAAMAGVLVTDDFTGNSGSVPTNWSELPLLGFNSGGSAVETGTVVNIDDPIGGIPFYLTPGTYNPQGETSTFSAQIAGITGGAAYLALSDPTITHFMILSVADTGAVSILSSNAGVGAAVTNTPLASLASYTGGAVDMSIEFDAVGFIVTGDGGAYTDSGTWASIPFDLNAAGTNVDLVIGADGGFASFDSVLFSVTGDQEGTGGGGAASPVPAPAAISAGLLALLVVRASRRRAHRQG